MTSLSLTGYRCMTPKILEQYNEIAREKYLMGIAQNFFDAHHPREPICIGQERDGHVCLERDGVLLAVYFSERGGKNLIGFFNSLTHALDFLGSRYLGILKLPLDWPALNNEFDKLNIAS
jgi:hypothetical protein